MAVNATDLFEFRLPDIGEGVAEGEIVKWHVAPGASVREDDALVDIMTDKVTAEIPSPVSGVVQSLKYPVGAVVPVGAVLVAIDPRGDAAEKFPSEHAACSPSSVLVSVPVVASGMPEAPEASQADHVLAAPATRKLARTLGVDLARVRGSGPRGRVTPADVRAAATEAPVLLAEKPPIRDDRADFEKSFAPASTQPALMTEERVPLAGLRRRIAEHLVHAKRTAPHFGYVDEIDMTEIVRLREALKPQAEAEQIRLTFLPFILRAVISGLKAFPMLNASLDDERQEIVYKRQYNIGVAVATEAGLVVPVIHQADEKTLKRLAIEIDTLSQKARDGKLAREDVQGGTFTLTSIGSVGGLFGLPIINHPEVAIVGINKIADRPVVRDGEIQIAKMMYLSLSCDHRVVDGVDAARFVNHVKELLEHPARLLYTT